jgi:hypothetical protein
MLKLICNFFWLLYQNTRGYTVRFKKCMIKRHNGRPWKFPFNLVVKLSVELGYVFLSLRL